jgi:hypothetical protein
VFRALVLLLAAGGCTSRPGTFALPDGAVPGAWSVVPAPTTADLWSVFVPEAGDVWIQGDRLYHSSKGGVFGAVCVAVFCGGETPGSCSPMAPTPCSTPGATPITGHGVFGLSASDVWAGNYARSIMHFDGTAWTSFHALDNRAAGAFWGTAHDDVWGVDILGNGYRGHYDGATWNHVNNYTFGAIWGADRDHYWGVSSSLWMVGGPRMDPGTVSTWSSTADPTDVYTGAVPLFGIWGAAANDLWAVGAAGAIVHFDGAAWSATASPTTKDLHWVWGRRAADVWAVGAGGTILHHDGTSWSVVASPTTKDLYGVAGSASEVWAVGAAGTLLVLPQT